jgi:hypothetical protein
MAFDSPIANTQGGAKASEIAMDRQLEIIKTQNNETALKSIELLMKPLGDAIRLNNFILHSTGQIRWTGTDIEFDSDSQANHIIFRLLLTDETSARTIDVYLTGTTGSNSATLFNTLTLANQELLYLEIDRAQLLAAVSPSPGVSPARLTIGNNVSSSSLAVGARLQKVSLSDTNGMPAMLSTESGLTTSQTLNIPLASRFDWTDGVSTFNDIWWIPHGIRWPAGTRSVLGAVVVKGLETLPSTFVRNEAELTTALTDYATTGGIILLSASITLTTQLTVPSGVTLTTRSNLSTVATDLTALPVLTMNSGSRLTLANDSKLWNIIVRGAAAFGFTTTEYMVLMSGNNARIENCSFRLQNSVGAGTGICVEVTGTNNRIWDSKFRLGVDVPQRVGIRYSAGSNNNDIDSTFEAT